MNVILLTLIIVFTAVCSWVRSVVGKENWEPLSTQPLVSSSVIGVYANPNFLFIITNAFFSQDFIL